MRFEIFLMFLDDMNKMCNAVILRLKKVCIGPCRFRYLVIEVFNNNAD
jgi:hypothetical protein